jgi:class 3 adenylate cyclase
MGIGLNSGHFMSGNVGSARRVEYTVHGDTVNTAARLQEMTKSTRHAVLASESVRRALVRPPSDLAFVGEWEVRGRRSAITLWTLAPVRCPVAATGPQDLAGARGRD